MIFERKNAHAKSLLLTSQETARILNISERTLFTLAKNGGIPVVRIGRAVRYARQDISALLEKSKS